MLPGFLLPMPAGAGGNTGNGPTDGILVVEILDAGNSDTNAFALGAPVTAGAYEYNLFQADGLNWYLQSEVATTVKAYAGSLSVARLQGLHISDTLHDRMGELRTGLFADRDGQNHHLPSQFYSQDEDSNTQTWLRLSRQRRTV